MPAATKPVGYTTPACRLDEHDQCHGNRTVQMHECQVPVQTLRCDCTCHRAGAPR